MACTAEDLIREKNEEVCRETADAMLFSKIRAEFGEDADDIIALILCGESVDAAIQSIFMD